MTPRNLIGVFGALAAMGAANEIPREYRGYDTGNLIRATGSYNKAPADAKKRAKRKAARAARKVTRQAARA